MAAEVGGVLDDRYELADVIGVGAMGQVYRGFDRRLEREVAVKVVHPDLARQLDLRARFEHEARAAAQLSHPSAVTVFDSGEDDGTPFLVMECLPGRTLADEIRGGPLPARQVREIAVDLLGALGAAHELGIIHRDVKPGNILFGTDGRVKLADFGIAKSTDGVDQTSTGQLIGTAAYLAPERLDGKPASPASDLYSLGVVLYEALTGDKPFPGDTPVAVAHAILSAPPPRPSTICRDLDPNFDAVVVRALAKDARDRYPSAGAMLAALDDPEPSASGVEDHRPSERLPVADVTATIALSSAGPADSATTAFRNEPGTLLAPIPAGGGETSPEAGRPRKARRGSRARMPARAAVLVACVVALILVALAVNDGRQPEVSPPASTTTSGPAATPTSTMPGPLDRALTDLERAVQP